MNYKFEIYTDVSARKDVQNEDKCIHVINNQFDCLQQNLTDFVQYAYSKENINEEIIKQSTVFFNEMNSFVQQGCDLTLINVDTLGYLFSLPIYLIDNNYTKFGDESEPNQDSINLFLGFVNLINSFSEISSDEICSKFLVTNYLNTLIHILNNIDHSAILMGTIKCFINLLNQKPILGQSIPFELYGFLYNAYNIFNLSKRNLHYDPNLDKNSQVSHLKCACIESLCNFEVFLPSKYQQVVDENINRNPEQLLSALMLLIKYRSEDNITDFETDFFFKMIEKIFRYANQDITKHYFKKQFVALLFKYLGPNFNFKYDKVILFCLSRIAESGATPACCILCNEFLQYKPYEFNDQTDENFNKQLIIDYCNLWYTIMTSLSGPSQILLARQRGMNFLKNVSDSIIEMTNNILSQQKDDYEFELIKSTTYIHISMINLNDNELISKVLNNFPDICDRIQQVIEEENPETMIYIINAIENLTRFVQARGSQAFPKISTWIRSNSLFESLKNAQLSLSEYENVYYAIEKFIKK